MMERNDQKGIWELLYNVVCNGCTLQKSGRLPVATSAGEGMERSTWKRLDASRSAVITAVVLILVLSGEQGHTQPIVVDLCAVAASITEVWPLANASTSVVSETCIVRNRLLLSGPTEANTTATIECQGARCFVVRGLGDLTVEDVTFVRAVGTTRNWYGVEAGWAVLAVDGAVAEFFDVTSINMCEACLSLQNLYAAYDNALEEMQAVESLRAAGSALHCGHMGTCKVRGGTLQGAGQFVTVGGEATLELLSVESEVGDMYGILEVCSCSVGYFWDAAANDGEGGCSICAYGYYGVGVESCERDRRLAGRMWECGCGEVKDVSRCSCGSDEFWMPQNATAGECIECTVSNATCAEVNGHGGWYSTCDGTRLGDSECVNSCASDEYYNETLATCVACVVTNETCRAVSGHGGVYSTCDGTLVVEGVCEGACAAGEFWMDEAGSCIVCACRPDSVAADHMVLYECPGDGDIDVSICMPLCDDTDRIIMTSETNWTDVHIECYTETIGLSLWGAGGAGSLGFAGGAGGYVRAVIPVEWSEADKLAEKITLRVLVGEGGLAGFNSPVLGGGGQAVGWVAGGGGGYSAVVRLDAAGEIVTDDSGSVRGYWAIAGGGGGGALMGAGGLGGGLAASPGGHGAYHTVGGGSLTGPGVCEGSPLCGDDGVEDVGGDGYNSDMGSSGSGGGGGGGGFHGGSGGFSEAGGGGGSGYVSTTALVGVTLCGSGWIPAGASSPGYAGLGALVGRGGTLLENGTSGGLLLELGCSMEDEYFDVTTAVCTLCVDEVTDECEEAEARAGLSSLIQCDVIPMMCSAT